LLGSKIQSLSTVHETDDEDLSKQATFNILHIATPGGVRLSSRRGRNFHPQEPIFPRFRSYQCWRKCLRAMRTRIIQSTEYSTQGPRWVSVPISECDFAKFKILSRSYTRPVVAHADFRMARPLIVSATETECKCIGYHWRLRKRTCDVRSPHTHKHSARYPKQTKFAVILFRTRSRPSDNPRVTQNKNANARDGIPHHTVSPIPSCSYAR
jgi:hypothetical protein